MIAPIARPTSMTQAEAPMNRAGVNNPPMVQPPARLAPTPMKVPPMAPQT